jgi:hypothetical protein
MRTSRASLLAWLACAALCAGARAAHADASGDARDAAAPGAPWHAAPPRAAWPLGVLPIEEPVLLARVTGGTGNQGAAALSPERAQHMLQSLTIPGWGQLSAGHPTAAKTFFLIDLGIWTSFVAFQVQDQMRINASVNTAKLFAGIDLSGRSEQYRRIVGIYASSDEYNQLVVYRDAANLYYNDPAAYRSYIAAHSIGGADAWAWTDEASFDRYRGQRKNAERAGQRANTALILAFANRLVSAIHAASVTHSPGHAGHALGLELTPDASRGYNAWHLGLRASF